MEHKKGTINIFWQNQQFERKKFLNINLINKLSDHELTIVIIPGGCDYFKIK